MTDSHDPHSKHEENENPSWVQRFMEQPFWLLGAGLFVMFLFYTGWGWFEIYNLPQSLLP